MALYSFDETFYLTNNPDVVNAIAQGAFVSAEQHYLLYGEAEGRRPNAEFDPHYYYSQNPDVLNAGLSALEHFEMFGLAEGRQPSEQVPYSEAAYLAANPDVADAVAAGTFASGWQHYVFFGSAEGRSPDGDGTAITGDTFVLTPAVDDFSGGSANDLFLGVTGSQDTLSIGDNLDGGGGSDIVRIFTDGDHVNFGLANVANIENVEIQSRSDTLDWINLNDLGGAFQTLLVDFDSFEQADNLDVERIAPNTAVTLQNADFDDYDVDVYLNEQAEGINGYMRLSNIDDADIDVWVDDSGNGSAADDVFTLVLDGVKNTDGDMDWYTTDVETLNVVVESDSALENIGNYYNDDGSPMGETAVNLTLNGNLRVESFWDFNDVVGPFRSEKATFTITGSGDLYIAELDDGDTALTVDASAATGDIQIYDIEDNAVSVTTGIGNDVIGINRFDTKVAVGDGDDGVIILNNLTNASSFDGGDGTDWINITDGAVLTAATAPAIANFEILDVSSGTGSYDVSLNGFTQGSIAQDGGPLAGAVTFANAPDAFTLSIISAVGNASFDVGNDTTVALKDPSGTTAKGTAETFTLVASINDGDQDNVADGSIEGRTVTVAGVENLVITANVDVLDGGNQALKAVKHTFNADLVADAAETLTIGGNASVDLAGVAFIGVLTKIDAAGSTGNVTIDMTAGVNSIAYTGSAGVDTYEGTALGDIIYSGKGGDVVTLGAAGARDTFVIKAGTDSQITDSSKDGKLTIAADSGWDQVFTFDTGGGLTDDRLDVTNLAFSGSQRGVVDVTAMITATTDLTNVADLFNTPAGDRGIAFATVGADTVVFIDTNKDGDFTASADAMIQLVAVPSISETDINF